MRIAMVGLRGLTSRYSGIETSLQAFCPRLVARGHEVTVFGDQDNVGSFHGVRLEAVPALRSKHFETLSRSFVATWRSLARRFDVIHFHDVAPALWSPMARLAGVPTLLTLHSLDWKRSKWSALSQTGIRVVEQVAMRSVRRVAVVSQSLQTYVRDSYRLSAVLLPHVVEHAAYVEPSAFSRELNLETRKYVLFAGRLVREKALHELIRAFKTIATDFKLIIAGEGRYEDQYERELRELAQGADVVFTGQVSRAQLQELYSNAYLFVLPSHLEGRSMAVLEALGSGTPVLVSDIPENTELVGDEACTFQTGNEAELAATLSRLIHCPEEVDAMRERTARALHGATTWDDYVTGYERLYRELAGGR
jgi:glycosyltransferase involved in cell wall biosynthesis